MNANEAGLQPLFFRGSIVRLLLDLKGLGRMDQQLIAPLIVLGLVDLVSYQIAATVLPGRP